MRLNDLDLNLIKSFVAVADEKTFTRAGTKLFVEQSAVSKAIKRLEIEIGTQLFVRTKRRVQLTSKGRELLGIARQILQSTAELLRAADDAELELSGTLKFGAASPLSFLFLPQVIAEISTTHTKLWPLMFTGLTDDIAQRVQRRDLEFAILDYEGERLKDLEYREIGHLEFRLVTSPRISRQGMNSFVGSREIHDQDSPKLPTFEKLKRLNKELRIKYSANDMMAYKELVKRGLGIGLLPEVFVRDDLRTKKLKIVHPELKLQFPIWAVHQSRHPLSLEATQLIEILQDSLKTR